MAKARTCDHHLTSVNTGRQLRIRSRPIWLLRPRRCVNCSHARQSRASITIMDEYENHIFISYRRPDAGGVRWTRDNFVRALTSLLRPRLGPIRVFMDETIEDGAAWPNHLARSLSRSRIMVPVLSRDYFQSDWCRLE